MAARVDPNEKDLEGDTPLLYALLNEHYDIAEYLVEQGVDVNISDGKEDLSPLMRAVMYNKQEIVELLIDRGAKVNAVDIDGYNTLSYAMRSNVSLNIVKYLLDNGANINIQDDDQRVSALMLAAGSQQKEKLTLLIKYGADLELKVTSEKTALMHAISNDNVFNKTDDEVIASNLSDACLEITESLLAAGATVNSQILNHIKTNYNEKYDKSALCLAEKMVSYRRKPPSLLDTVTQRFADGLAGNPYLAMYAKGYNERSVMIPEELSERITDAIPSNKAEISTIKPTKIKLNKWAQVIKEERKQAYIKAHKDSAGKGGN